MCTRFTGCTTDYTGGQAPQQELMRLSGIREDPAGEEKYQKARRRLQSEKQRQRRLLLADLVERFKKEQPVIDSERQLAGKVVDEDTRDALAQSDQVTPEHLLLIDAILTLPETSLENEYQRRIAAVNAITAYCGVEEGPAPRRIQRGRPVKDESPPVLKTEEPDALSQAIRSIKNKKRPTKCFLCLGNPFLALRDRVTSYATPGSLSRHFLRKRVNKLQEGVRIDCQICGDKLKNRVELLIHAERFHGTVSRGPAERLIT
ncbi:hypothetical protein B0O99DRAFT_699067 [Bisporella sp. PMI_857]|nr:hypothetical protein B0O99DRAFT_699067 [Bisporella sp. PMI_857]